MEEQERQENFRPSKGVLGMPVYSIQEGQNLGSVKNLVIDAKEKRLLALVVEKRRLAKDEKLLPFVAVKSVGDDVVTVERGQALERRGVDPAVMRALRRPVQPVGARCFTAGGKTLGKVEEYYFDAADGRIAQLEISDGSLFKGRMLVDGQYIIAMAPHTVMLADEAFHNCRPVESNLLSSMEVARDKAAGAARNTMTMLGNSLSKIKGMGAAQEAPEPEEAEPQPKPEEAAPQPKPEGGMLQSEQGDAILQAAPQSVPQEVTPTDDAVPAKEAAAERLLLQPAHSPLAVEVLLPEEAAEPGQSVNAAPPGLMRVEAADEDEEEA